jgi:hypothetical protein
LRFLVFLLVANLQWSSLIIHSENSAKSVY